MAIIKREGNYFLHVFDCKSCDEHFEKWVYCAVPSLVYCTPCALRIIDEFLEERDDAQERDSSEERQDS